MLAVGVGKGAWSNIYRYRFPKEVSTIRRLFKIFVESQKWYEQIHQTENDKNCALLIEISRSRTLVPEALRNAEKEREREREGRKEGLSLLPSLSLSLSLFLSVS